MGDYYRDYRNIKDSVKVLGTPHKGRIVGTATVFDSYGAHLLYVVYLTEGFYSEGRTTYVSMMLCESSNLISNEEV